MSIMAYSVCPERIDCDMYRYLDEGYRCRVTRGILSLCDASVTNSVLYCAHQSNRETLDEIGGQ